MRRPRPPAPAMEVMRRATDVAAAMIMGFCELAGLRRGTRLSALRAARRQAEIHEATVQALVRAIDAKHQPSGAHIRRMRQLAAALAERLGMTPGEIETVKTAAVLHDVGKLAVPTTVLQKPGPLTAAEFELVRVHPQIGAEIVASVPFDAPVAPLILCHHERWDGRGYPAGLAGTDIPLGARIIAVVDCYDALICDRPHRGAVDVESALATLREESGRALDPHVVEAFFALVAEGRIAAVDMDEGLRDEVGVDAFETIRHTHREVAALYEVSRALTASLGVEDVARVLGVQLRALVPYDSYAFFTIADDDAMLCRHACGLESEALGRLRLAPGAGSIGRAIASGEALVDGRPDDDFRAAAATRQFATITELRSTLAVPLVCGTRVIGAIAVYHTGRGHYGVAQRRLLEQVAARTAAVLDNAQRFERAREESLTDPLTGLPNTRFLSMHLTQEIARARRQRSQLAVLLLDLDYFKPINDTYGHAVGDRVIKAVADALRSAIRAYDVCVRYAGDEFVIMLPECGPDQVEERMRDLENTVQGVRLLLDDGAEVHLSASIGAAVSPIDGDSYERLLNLADRRMYARKARRSALGAVMSHPPGPAVENELVDRGIVGERQIG